MFHLLPTTLQTGDFDFAMKQSRYDILKLESALALKFICYPKCLCVVQVINKRHGSVVTSTNLGAVFPCLYEPFGVGVTMVRMQRGVGSVEQAQVRDLPDLHFTIMEFLYKVFVRGLIAIAKQPVQYAPLPGSVSQFLHQLTQYLKKASSQCSQYAKMMSFHFHSRLLTTSEKSKIPSENFLQPPRGQRSESCRRWTPR